jgi:hypothetical protein
MDESLLTGESNNIEKRPGDELFSGSFVVAGAVTARVTRVGLDGYAAKINAEAHYVKAVSSEILSTLNTIIRVSTIALVPLGIGLFLRTVYMDGTSINDAILSTVAAVVGIACKPVDIARDDLWNGVSFAAIAIVAETLQQRTKFRVLAQARKIRLLSETDLLTGVKNRNHFEVHQMDYAEECEASLFS